MSRPFATCTVVIPCYNGAATLPAAVESVLAQTFQDFHLVLVDDVSTDNTREVIRTLAAGRPNITVIELTANGGQSAARNRGTEATTGPYVAFLDQDDSYHREFLRNTVEALSRSPQLDRVKVLPNISIEVDPAQYQVISNSLSTTSLIRRAAFEFVGGWPESRVFREHQHAGEDVAFEILFGFCYDTGLIQSKLYNHSHRPGNALDKFLKRTTVVAGQVQSKDTSRDDDQAISDEINRLKQLLRARIRQVAANREASGFERLK